MITTFIYALKCPTTGEIRYVGKANKPVRRFSGHLSKANKENNHRACWLRSLKSQGLQPVLEILDEVLEEHWQQWEAAWIDFFRESGITLTNSTPGGEGRERFTHTPEARAKISAFHKGRKKPPGFSDKMRARKGEKRSPEVCAKLSALHKGVPWTEAKRLALANRKLSPEHRAKIGASLLGRKRPPEIGAKISAAKKGKGKPWSSLRWERLQQRQDLQKEKSHVS